MTTKKQMLELIRQVKDADESFMMNECCGTDLLMDAVNNHLDKLSKADLKVLFEKARQQKYYNPEMEEGQCKK